MHLTINAISLDAGGGLTGLIGYLNAWRELGVNHRITIYASRKIVIDEIKKIRPDIKVVPFAYGAPSFKHFFAQQILLGREISKEKSDVIMTTNHLVGKCQIPQLVHHRNLKRFLCSSFLDQIKRANLTESVKDFYSHRALRLSASNVFISDFLRKKAETIVPESKDRNYVIYNGIPDLLVRNAENYYSGWDGKPNLIAIQDSSSHKDNPTLLKILAYLVQSEPDHSWHLNLAGGGEWNVVKKLAKKMGILDNISFLGFISQEQLDKIIRNSLCLVFTSNLEGFGNPLLEAMIRQCPVVASNTSAIPEVVSNAGILVTPGNVKEFATSIIHLYKDSDYRQELILKGTERAKIFNWNDSALKMNKLLNMCAHSTS